MNRTGKYTVIAMDRHYEAATREADTLKEAKAAARSFIAETKLPEGNENRLTADRVEVIDDNGDCVFDLFA